MSPEQTTEVDSNGFQKRPPNPPPKGGWWWQVFHERDGWASTTKPQRLAAFLVITILVLFFAYKEKIPDGFAEMAGIYLAYAVGARWASQASFKKEGGNVDGTGS
jgi:hypothetical protein